MDRLTLVFSHLFVLLIGFTLASTPVQYDASTTITGSRSATTNIVAVAEGGGGTIGTVTAQIKPGNGRVLLDTNPFIETDTQFSATTARNVAEQVTGTSLDDRDVIYTFSIEGDYIGGPSAGAAMTLATVAAIQNQSLPQDVVITGTIRPDGRVGKVGGILEKVVTAGNNRIETFYVPHGQEELTTYQQVIEEREYRGFRFQDIQYIPRTVSLNNITRERYDMAVEGIRNIGDVVQRLNR